LSPPHIGVGLFKIDQILMKKDSKETARLTILCNNDETCTVKTKGDTTTLIAALACLMITDSRDNQFREMMAVAIKVVISENKMKEKKAAKKKAAKKK